MAPNPEPAVLADIEQLPAVIQGTQIDSKEEGRVAVALGRLGYQFYYQYPYHGGRLIAGGQVIDFMVLTVPKWTPVFVQGEFWHKASTEAADALKQQEVANDGRFSQPVILWGSELTTIEDAQAALQRSL